MSNNIQSRALNLIGKEFETNNCGKCFIIDYNGVSDVTVIFYQPFCILKCYMSQLRSGELNNPMKPTYCGKGCIGVGKYSSKKDKLAYKHWTGLITRAFNTKWKGKSPSYKDVTVCEEWLNFQNFAEWCYSQEFFGFKDEKGKAYQLDKDVLMKGNKTYSPDMCSFVPCKVNNLFVRGERARGGLPIGVHYNTKVGKLIALISDEKGKRTHLGCFDEPIQAFLAYKKAKEVFIKAIAERYRSVISSRVYDTLIKYQVEITD